MTDNSDALHALHTAADHAHTAWQAAKQATARLGGARAARAGELVAMLSDAIVYAERIAVIVQGDLRADALSEAKR